MIGVMAIGGASTVDDAVAQEATAQAVPAVAAASKPPGTVTENLPTDSSVCPQGGRMHRTSTSIKSHYQAEAEYESQQMAARRYKGHIRGPIPGVRFCGVGWSSSSPTPPTCTPGSGLTLVADAITRGSDGWYRVRYWR